MYILKYSVAQLHYNYIFIICQRKFQTMAPSVLMMRFAVEVEGFHGFGAKSYLNKVETTKKVFLYVALLKTANGISTSRPA